MMTSRVDALGGTSTYEYDADGLLLTAVTNELGHVARATYDPAWQLIEERTDINGARTRYTYDPRGRVETVVRPGDSDAFPTLRYERRDDVLPLSVRTEKRRRANAASAYEKVTYFDGFGREIQTRSRVDGEQVRVTGTVGYNRKGDVVAKGTPLLRQGLDFEAPDVLPPTPVFNYRHDSLGRVIAAVNLEGREMLVRYTPWSAKTADVIDTDPAHPHRDTPEIKHFDAFGRIVGVTLTSAPGVTHRASYRYDLLGRLVATTDLEGRPAIISASYDNRGARLRFVHASAGARTMVFDAAGRVVRYSDDRKIVVARQHDALGRLVSEAVGGVVQERLHWDLTPGPARPARTRRRSRRPGDVRLRCAGARRRETEAHRRHGVSPRLHATTPRGSRHRRSIRTAARWRLPAGTTAACARWAASSPRRSTTTPGC